MFSVPIHIISNNKGEQLFFVNSIINTSGLVNWSGYNWSNSNTYFIRYYPTTAGTPITDSTVSIIGGGAGTKVLSGLTQNTQYTLKMFSYPPGGAIGTAAEIATTNFKSATSAATLESLILNDTPYSTTTGSCSDNGDSSIKYFNGSGTPVVLDIIYNDSVGSNVFNGNNQWYKTTSGSVIQISGTGVILGLVFCNPQ